MNSSTSLAIASVALFVLVFRGGEASDVVLENILRPQSNLETVACEKKCLEYNTTRLIGGKISCVPTLTRHDYVIVPDVGAYKIHIHKTTWHNARKICLAEGGQLAVMDSPEKHEIFQKWKQELNNVMGLWLGFHDLFEEGTWVTVTGEPIDSIGYYPWADNEPNDAGGQDCAVLWNNGMDDYKCSNLAGFICEINLCETLGHQIHYSTYDPVRESYVFYG